MPFVFLSNRREAASAVETQLSREYVGSSLFGALREKPKR
jgi:hypothetical protein